MIDPTEVSASNLKGRLRCMLALSDAEADAIISSGPATVDAEAIAKRVNLEPSHVRRLMTSHAAVEAYRINPNRVTRAQLYLVPGIGPDRIRSILDGRPYFSMAEFEAASGLPREEAAKLFGVPKLTIRDKITGRVTNLRAVPDKYILLPRLDFESPGLVADLGFVERTVGAGAPIRVLVPSETETLRQPHDLKAAFGGQVFPVLRDDEGFERYLVPNSLDVWFERGVSHDQALKMLAELQLRIKRSFPRIGYYLVESLEHPADFDVTTALLDLIQELNQRPEIRLAEADQVGFEDFAPEFEQSLPDFEDASAGSRTWNLEIIELAAAHDMTEGSPDATVALIDSGMRLDHPDLSAALRPDWMTLDLNFDVGVLESEMSPLELAISHGTKVASVAGGRGPAPGIGVRGIAPACWLLPVKISGSPFGQSYGLRAAAIFEAIDYIDAQKRGVLNLSWSTNGEHIGVREALIEASEKGLAITTSAGNYQPYETQVADQKHYPSCYAVLPGDTDGDVAARRKIRGLVSVAAVNAFRQKASYSYYGSRSVTVSAPGGEPGQSGVGIYVASTPQNYSYDAGTSMASPHAAGLIALLFSADSTLSATEAIDILRVTATDLDAANTAFAGMLGAGLINARAALEVLIGTPPTPSMLSPGTDAEPSAFVLPVNINTATQSELIALPFIGDWTAGKIVMYRAENGPFSSIWDLTLTGAIDAWAVEQIQDLITVEPVAAPAMPPPALTTPQSGAPLNINTATREALIALPLIGAWSADKIIAYRDANGPFSSIWDLTRTGAVDAWAVQQIQDLITAT